MDRVGLEAVLLAGPTASGKSALAIRLAEAFGGEVINADSMQVYRDLSIITARPEPGDLARAPHRLFGHVDGATNHSVGLWREDAGSAIAAVREAGRLPILVGGTGLYFRALERGLASMPAVPDEVRRTVRESAEGMDAPALHARLAAADPATAAVLRPSDPQRILRALEIFEATGRPLSDWQREPHSPALVEAKGCVRLFLSPEREDIYGRIDRRFDRMMEAGAIDEVAALGARRLDPTLPVMRAHGVPGLLRYLAGEVPLAQAIQRGKTDTRHYARRQFTWFRHQMPGWTMVSPDLAFDVAAGAIERPAARR